MLLSFPLHAQVSTLLDLVVFLVTSLTPGSHSAEFNTAPTQILSEPIENPTGSGAVAMHHKLK
jgi:hypothetical protein